MPIEINVPGSKSIANRALILSFLTKSNTKFKNLPDSDDVLYMQKALKKLQSKDKKISINIGNAGTTTRFLTAISPLLGKTIKIDGNKRMRERPIKILIDALNNLGANIESKTGCPPVTINPQKAKGGNISLAGNVSSQYISALLMLTPFLENDSKIKITKKLYSKPYIEITLNLLNKFGLEVKNNKFEQFSIKGSQEAKKLKTFTIEADASSASYLGAYALMHPEKEIQINNLFKSSIQGDIAFLKYLKRMGAVIKENKKGTIIKAGKKLKNLGEIDMNSTPDLVMTFAVLAMFTEGKTKITNVENLKIKETDRLGALKNEISKFGIKVKTGKSYIEIIGNPKLTVNKKIDIETYDDHRMAMCFGILEDIFPKLKVKNKKCVSKSYTSYWEDLKKLKNA
jgi:3-phosphoshikimate 1-carboxyvinyltransferase